MKSLCRNPWIYFFLICSILVVGCNSQKQIRASDYDFSSKEDDVHLLRVDSLSGYLYEFYQEKCPGTTISEPNSPCVRLGFLYSVDRLTKYKNVLFRA